MLKRAVKRRPDVGAVVSGAPSAPVAAKWIVSVLSGLTQVDPVTNWPLTHRLTTNAGPVTAVLMTLPVKSTVLSDTYAGTRRDRFVRRVMSKPSIGSEPLMKTPIRICCPAGPLKTGGGAGQGFAAARPEVTSARHTNPVKAAWTRGVSTGATKTIDRSKIGSKTRIFLLDIPRHLPRLVLRHHSI
jgi:hypothetical protein